MKSHDEWLAKFDGPMCKCIYTETRCQHVHYGQVLEAQERLATAFYANTTPCSGCGHPRNAHDGPHGECLADVMHGADPDSCGCVVA